MKTLRALLYLVLFGWLAVLVFAFLRKGVKAQQAAAAAPPLPAALTTAPPAAAPPAAAPSSSAAAFVGTVDSGIDAVDKLGVAVLAKTVPVIGPAIQVADQLLDKAPIPDLAKDFIRNPLTAQVKLAAAAVPVIVDGAKAVAGAIADGLSAVGDFLGFGSSGPSTAGGVNPTKTTRSLEN